MMLRMLVSSEPSVPLVDNADQNANDKAIETKPIWDLIDSFVAGRMSLIQVQRESMVARGVFDRAVALFQDESKKASASTDTKRKHGTSPVSVNKKRRTSYGCFDEESKPSRQAEHQIEGESNPMHVIVRFLGRRQSIANIRSDKQTAQYQSVRSFVMTRKEKLLSQLEVLQGSMREENQNFIQNLLAFDLYKIKPSSPPKEPNQESCVEKLSEMERLQTELTLWSLLHQDIEQVFGSDDKKK